MRKKSLNFIVGFILAGCSNENALNVSDNENYSESPICIDFSSDANSANCKYDEELYSQAYLSNFVSIENVCTVENALLSSNNYTMRVNPADIIPIVSEDKDTILYVVNYPAGGYKIYSTDKRITPILLESKEGKFSFDNADDVSWIALVSDKIIEIKKRGDKELLAPSEEISANRAFWNSVCYPTDFVKRYNNNFYSSTRSFTPPEIIPGYYELISSVRTIEVYDSISHLIDTKWHQGTPYNNYCPFRTDKPNERVAAGCVPVAGAQLLYYLHKNFSYPATAPQTAYCPGDITNPNWWQDNFSSNTWSLIQSDSAYSAPLIANLARLSEINYDNEGGSTNLRKLRDYAFSSYNVGCDYLTYYSVDSVKNNLLRQLPVIVSAYAGESGHTFILDGYKRMRMKTTNTYAWVYTASENPSILPVVKDKITISYSSPSISYFKINWGDGFMSKEIAYCNDSWYSAAEEYWKQLYYPDNSTQIDSLTYDSNIKMIVNFRNTH